MPKEVWTLCFVSLYRSSKEGSNGWHFGFMWSPVFWIAAYNWMFKWTQTFSKLVWLRDLISVDSIRIRCKTLCIKVLFFWISQTSKEKRLVRLSQVIWLTSLLQHIFQSMNLEKFRSKENELRVKCENELHPARKQNFVGMVDLESGHKCPAFDNKSIS